MIDENVPGFLHWYDTPAGRVPVISSLWRFADHAGAWKSRWGIGRMSYLVPPGLYALGKPGADDPVVVTANYKMSYDIVRRELSGRNIWLLVLETFGINVWCAAGKETFSTDEVVRRVEAVELAKVVKHRRLLLPILGAPGVAAHLVRKLTGFSVHYAAVNASDLPKFLDNGMVTAEAMRELTFNFRERLVLVPVELVQAVKAGIPILVLLCLFGGFTSGFTVSGVMPPVLAYLGSVFVGTVLTPLFLSWLPTRSFAIKGAVLGIAWAFLWHALRGEERGWLDSAAIFIFLTVVSAYHGLNFTGCTPFTSRSGVKKEIRRAFPIMAVCLILAGTCWLLGRFLP